MELEQNECPRNIVKYRVSMEIAYDTFSTPNLGVVSPADQRLFVK